jgi:hypothetical protein
MNYAEVNNSNNQIIRELNLYSAPPTNKFGPDKETRIIPIIVLEQPEFNSETEYVTYDQKVVYLDRVEQTWKIEQNPIPSEVPLWAFRSILTIMGIAPQVDALINSLPEPQKTVASVQWQYGNFIERNHPLIDSLGTNLGLTKEQIDNVFVEASKLK